MAFVGQFDRSESKCKLMLRLFVCSVSHLIDQEISAELNSVSGKSAMSQMRAESDFKAFLPPDS